MKRIALICLVGFSLSSCSLLQRRNAGSEEDAEAHEAAEAPTDGGPLFDSNGKELSGGSESEVSRLNTKVAALETKIDVLTANLERIQAQKSQPIIEAEPPRPQETLAAPVEDREEITPSTPHISAAPAKPAPMKIKHVAEESTAPASGAEKEFRAGMQLFQNGQNLEAASRFAFMAKKYPRHLLAGHALYWAGEASARAQQWELASQNWAELEQQYPRSAYLPEALAGLARAHEAQGDSSKAKHYRSLLVRSFPKSPVALQVAPMTEAPATASRIHRASEAPAASDEVQAPEFDGGAQESSQESSAELQ